MLWQLFVTLACFIVAGFVATVVYILYQKRREQQRYLDITDAEIGATKMWIGDGDNHNPTDRVELDVTSLKKKPDPASEERFRERMRSAANFCRSTPHERILEKPIPQMGGRENKFYASVKDVKISARLGADTPLLMTMITLDSDHGVIDATHPKHGAKLQRMFTCINHTHILPTYDVAISLDQKIVILRPYSSEGSLRDYIFDQKSPNRTYHDKYEIGVGRPIRLAKLVQFGRQILEGLKWLQMCGLPYYHLHTGNVILHNGACRLTDYENAFCGFKNRLHSKIKKCAVDPTLCCFAFVLYEMATGREAPTPVKGKVDLSIHDREYKDLEDVFDTIFSSEHVVTLDELIANKLFRSVPIKTIPWTSNRSEKQLQDPKIQKSMIEPTFQYYIDKVYKHSTRLTQVVTESIADDDTISSKSNRRKDKKKSKEKGKEMEEKKENKTRPHQSSTSSVTSAVGNSFTID